MGLFDKKYCDICGEKISLLGNKKLEDGNMCSSCAKLISPLYVGRRQTSVAEMKAHLAYREENKQKLAQFVPSETYAEREKIYIDKNLGCFVVSYDNPGNWEKENPDVIPLSEVTTCILDIRENETEEYYTDSQGNEKSYSPPRYIYDYDFYIKITLSSKWFSEIEVKLNSSDVEGKCSNAYNNYEMIGNQIISDITGRPMQMDRRPDNPDSGTAGGYAYATESNAPTCTACGTGIPNKDAEKRKFLDKVQSVGVSSENLRRCSECNRYLEGQFCPDCGSQTEAPAQIKCACCGYDIEVKGVIPKFCPACGDKIDIDDVIM